MSATRPGQLLRRLSPPDPDDGPLLARFAADRDPAAFAALVRRHGPVVLAVCRRVTGHPQDAEDAFQAVFLVLARKAGSIRDPGRLGNWLYGVAVRVAGRARRAAARRRVREVQVVDTPDPAAPDQPPPADIGPALHEELAALPAHYREALVLCDLQGAARSEAAKALGIPEGTLSSRLATGRRKLADRLTRRGVALTVAGVPAAVADGRAAVPESLVSHTCGVVAAWAAGRAVPAAVTRLASGGVSVKSALLGGVLTLSLVAGAVVAGVGTDPAPAPRPSIPPHLPDPVPVATAGVAVAEAEAQEPDPPPRPRPNGVGFTSGPTLREAIDLPLRGASRVVWSPTGDRLAAVAALEGSGPAGMMLGGAEGGAGGPGGGVMGETLYLIRTTNPVAPRAVGFVNIAAPQRFIDFTPDGTQIVTTQREQKLVSGKHRVTAWDLGGDEGPGGPAGPGVLGGGAGPGGIDVPLTLRKSFDIDPEQSNDYVFAADGKSYRTLILTRDENAIRKIAVRRVDAETGKPLDVMATIGGTFRTAQLTADGTRVVTLNAQTGAVEMHPLGGGAGWSVLPELNVVEGSASSLPYPAGLSRNGGRILISSGFCRPALLDGTTGKSLPPLEGADLVNAYAGGATFSPDGRLVAFTYQRVEKKETLRKGGQPVQTSYSAAEARLGVWNTATGKLVRSWPGRVTAIAFHPTRPVLAVLEPNGAPTRLGLWDFSGD